MKRSSIERQFSKLKGRGKRVERGRARQQVGGLDRSTTQLRKQEQAKNKEKRVSDLRW